VACGQTTRHARKNREEHVGGAHPKKRKKCVAQKTHFKKNVDNFNLVLDIIG